ncbi:GntR family transcriptional regulator [Streptomyces flavidovirens]|uniref:GntR family transcriptional regulator n=1 Tax=Streptomyces flavidovirens TaxID=67298 RepID=UPI00343EDA8F
MTRNGRSYGTAWSLAEDIAQSVWVTVARTGAKDVLREEPMDEQEALWVLLARAKQEIGAHFALARSTEQPVDWSDPATCNKLCPLMPSGCALMELPAYLAAMVATLPEAEREALLLKLDGLHPNLMAEHLECSDSTAARLVEAAVLMLRIDNPRLSGPAVAPECLEVWEQQALAELSEAKREALLRLDAEARQVLLLRAQGLSVHEIVKRLGISWDRAAGAARCVSVLRPATGKKSSGALKKVARGKREGSKAARLAATLRREVAQMQPGERLPRRTELKARFEVSTSTVDDAWAILRSEGLIESNGLQGYRVTEDAARMAVAA